MRFIKHTFYRRAFSVLILTVCVIEPQVNYASPPIVLHHTASTGLSNDGENPKATLIQGRDGNFYGTTSEGGGAGGGTIFKVTPAGTLTTLYRFSDDSAGTNPDGAFPETPLVEGKDGSFYGTTPQGGLAGNGTVFKITSTGKFAILHQFTKWHPMVYHNADGARPNAIILGRNGNFYGTTSGGGSFGNGTVFKITPSGVLTPLANFPGSHGTSPGQVSAAGFMQGRDDNFYGTEDNSVGDGTIFKIIPSGKMSILAHFNAKTTGSYPGAIVQGRDSYLYGTTGSDGPNGNGTVFRSTLNGKLVVLAAFCRSVTGSYCRAALVQYRDGNLYGTTANGSPQKSGTVFKIAPSGTLTLVHIFSPLSSSFPYGNADGAHPNGGLVLARDGNFYGTTLLGGSRGRGTVFRLTPERKLTTLVNFAGHS